MLMADVRRPLIALIALYAGAISVDRLGEGTIGWWVFLMAAVLAGVMLARGRRGTRITTVIGMALVPYGILKVLTFDASGPPAFDVYLAVTEAAFLVMITVFSARLSSGLQSLDDAIGSVVFGDNPAMPLEDPQAGNEILTEMARSRRHERPLSITVLAPDSHSFDLAVERAADDVLRAIRSRYVRGNIGRLIADQLRRSDILFEDARTGRFLVLSPETGDEGAGLLIGRIRAAASAAGLRLDTGTASFPDHAVSFEQLVELAERRLAGDPTVPPRLRAISGETGATP
jgi:hypothetical protein